MRIQHNIMAMNAYRNYNNNTSALSKNLEKLSSGYKINRAGDDAAGLAISEKMRAQITGLNAAQKNVKDGISLVKTAEGAMQEIHDMLNRMDYLATQSANGTYDNEVDRLNLQKEVNSLKAEINRIADSANFNGIKLLDGSMDANIKATDQVTENVTVDPTKAEALTFSSGKLAEVGQVLGVNTILHNEANTNGGTSFSIDFHNFTFNGAKGNTMNIKLGETEITLKATENHGKVQGETGAISEALLGGGGFEITVDGKTVDTLDGMQINGQTIRVEKDASLDYRLTFTQEDAPANEAEEINGAMNVTISGQVEPKKAQFTFEVSDFTDATGTAITPAAGDVLTINGSSYIVQADDIGGSSAASWENIIKNVEKEGIVEGYKIEQDGGTVTMTALEAGKKTNPTVAYKPTKDATGATSTGAGTQKEAGADASAATTTDAVTAKLEANGKFTFNGVEYTTTFDGTTAITDAVDIGDTGYQYTVATGTDGATMTITAKDAAGASANGKVTIAVGTNAAETLTFTGGTDAVKQTQEYDVTGWNNSNLGDFEGSVGTTAFALNYDQLTAVGEKGLVVKDEDGNDLGYIATLDTNTNKLTFTAKVAGAVNGTDGQPEAAVASGAFKVYGDASKLSEKDRTIEVVEQGAEGGEMQGITTGANGDFNVSTTNINNVAAGGSDRLASTFFDLTEDMVKDGATIKIGTKEYTFTTDEKKIEAATAGNITYVDARKDLVTTAKNLTAAAADNSVWTVGHDGSRITLTETVAHGDLGDKTNKYKDTYEFDLSTMEGIEKSLSFVGTGAYTVENVVSEATEGGKPLTLQIGDTSDAFNQLSLSIGDMHTKAMGIDEIDIGTQEGAQAAIDVIKNAINYVSGIRGDLGAVQNRLDHTANNLSVMAENIQDAESTIRDTDVADEMMAYTKNNILIQSAQAMLAQANQVPQGVLQLLG